MGSRHPSPKTGIISSPCRFFFFNIRSSSVLFFALIFLVFTVIILAHLRQGGGSSCPDQLSFPQSFYNLKQTRTNIDLRDAKFPWNKLDFGKAPEKLKLAVFSKTWPVGASPGGMERHAFTLYSALASMGHEIHVFTVPSDRLPHEDVHTGNLHVHFAANDHGSVNCSLAFEIYNREMKSGGFDYVHTESVSLPHWRAKMVPKVAVTWHGIWYEIMHSKLFQELLFNSKGQLPGPMTELQEAMPRLIDEIAFFPSYTQHICISNSAAEVLTNIYQLPSKNVHVILNGVDETVFRPDPEAGREFRKTHQIPDNASLVMGVSGRLVRDKGHPLLYEAFSSISKRHPGVYLLVAGSGPWEKRYRELGRLKGVVVLGALEPSRLSAFYNALDVFVNPTLRPQGLDLTLIEAMHCGKPVVTANYPSITGTVLVSQEFGHTFSPNVDSFVDALEKVVSDGPAVLRRRGAACQQYALGMFTATKMAAAYERFFLCMKDDRYCKYPLSVDP